MSIRIITGAFVKDEVNVILALGIFRADDDYGTAGAALRFIKVGETKDDELLDEIEQIRYPLDLIREGYDWQPHPEAGAFRLDFDDLERILL